MGRMFSRVIGGALSGVGATLVQEAEMRRKEMLLGLERQYGLDREKAAHDYRSQEAQTQRDYEGGQPWQTITDAESGEQVIVTKNRGMFPTGYKGELKAKPEPKARPTREVRRGGETVTEEMTGPDQWKEIGRGPAWEPNQPSSERGEEESWGQPVQEADETGKPIQVRYGNRGGRQIVDGARPAPRTRAPGQKLVNDLAKVGESYANLGRLNDTYKDEYGGKVMFGQARNAIGKITGDDTGQVQWWQDYQVYLNKVRNELFGAALTPTEQAEFEKAVVNPNMDSGEIRKNMKRQHELSARAALRQAKPNLAAGYDREVIEGALGTSLEEIEAAAKPSGPGGVAADGDRPAAGLPQGITESDVEATMRKRNMTREQVLEAFRKKFGGQ